MAACLLELGGFGTGAVNDWDEPTGGLKPDRRVDSGIFVGKFIFGGFFLGGCEVSSLSGSYTQTRLEQVFSGIKFVFRHELVG
jgi:hypothetical protein